MLSLLSPSQLSMKQLLASFLHSQQWKPVLQNVSMTLPPGAPEIMWLEWSPSGTSVLVTLVVFLGMKVGNRLISCDGKKKVGAPARFNISYCSGYQATIKYQLVLFKFD